MVQVVDDLPGGGVVRRLKGQFHRAADQTAVLVQVYTAETEEDRTDGRVNAALTIDLTGEKVSDASEEVTVP